MIDFLLFIAGLAAVAFLAYYVVVTVGFFLIWITGYNER